MDLAVSRSSFMVEWSSLSEEESDVIVLGFDGGNQFLDFFFFFLINCRWTLSIVERHRRSACRRWRLAWLISGVYQGVYGRSGRRRVVAGACSSKNWQSRVVM